MGKVALLWVAALFVLVLLLWSLMLASPAIFLGTVIQEEVFDEPAEPERED